MKVSGEMQLFVQTVESGGFSAAARTLDLTPSALSKQIARLEARLGVRLLNRTTRRLALTPEGETYFNRCKGILEEIRAAEAEITRFRERPSGLLRVTVGVAFGVHQLVPVLPKFLARYPDIHLDLSVTDHFVDLIDGRVDLAVRSGHLADSSLVARKISDLYRIICAAPDYLAKHGTPTSPDDLARHNCIAIGSAPQLKRWRFNIDGRPRVVDVAGNVVADNAETVLQLGVLGQGIIRLGDVVVAEPIQRGLLVPILTHCHTAEPLPLYAVYPRGKHRSPKLTAMVEFLLQEFGHAPWRI